MTYFENIREIIALPGLTAGARLILIYLFDKQGKNGYSWPSIETLCRDCGLSRPTVVGAIKKLADRGILTISHPKNPSFGNTNKYSVFLTGKESLPVETLDQLKNDTGTGKETLPVKKLNQLRNFTSTGKESLPEPVKKLNPNVSLTSNKRLTGENKFFSLVKTKQEKPIDPEMRARVFADLGLGVPL
jgi:hypothetical protein